MKLKLFKISAFVVGALPLLIGADALAFPGPPPAPPAGGLPRGGLPGGGLPGGGLPGGGLPRGGGFPGGGLPRGGGFPGGGLPRGGGFNGPSAPGGGFRAGGGLPISPSRAPNISRPGSSGPGGLAPKGNLAGKGPRPQASSRVPNINRPGSNGPGGLAPKSNLAGGGNKQPQLPSKVQSLPKGTGSVLPSIAQGNKLGPGAKQPGPGPQGNRFPDLSGKGPSELLNKTPEPLANQEFWKNWSAQSQGKLAEFQANRAGDWNNIRDFRNNQNIANSFNSPQWNDYKNNVQNYWDNRAVEVTNNIQNSFDNNFSSDWWKEQSGYSGKDYGGYGSYADKYASYYDKYWNNAEKYWWWGTATYATAAAWLSAYDRSGDSGYGSGSYDYGSGSSGYDSGNYYNGSSGSGNYGRSRSYDYGVNVAYQGDDVYVDGKRTASAKEYSQQAIDLANTSEQQPPAPMPPAEGKQADYLPLGVWAFVEEEKGDAYMFFQISIDKNGTVSGAYKNLLSGETSPISGQVDKKTQRVAWKIGSNSDTVIEAGLKNLTEDVASCLVHFGTDTTQTWLLVRLKDPDMSNATQSGPVADDSK